MHRNEEVEEGRKETVHPLHFAFVPCVDCPHSNTGFFGDLVQRGFLKAVSKKFRISSLNDPIIQEMIPSGHVFTHLRLNNNVNIDNDVVIAFIFLLFNANYTLL